MTEEFGGVHTIERRSGIERRASNWRDAVEQQRAERLRQGEQLVTALDALATDMRVPKHVLGGVVLPAPYWADRLAAALATHREPR
jgi:hypothetical protein